MMTGTKPERSCFNRARVSPKYQDFLKRHIPRDSNVQAMLRTTDLISEKHIHFCKDGGYTLGESIFHIRPLVYTGM